MGRVMKLENLAIKLRGGGEDKTWQIINSNLHNGMTLVADGFRKLAHADCLGKFTRKLRGGNAVKLKVEGGGASRSGR